ncbi:MAG: HAMP domain-containing histidine kinase [Bacilli bacterium]|nr:HAMP domain-containing histidine kinase [Bacilli bacterium]
MNSIIINVILIIFPILIYLVFSCYNLLTNNKIKKLIFIITMCTSLYLSLNFNQENNLLLIFCNIPTLICYFKKETKLGIIFSLIVVLISYFKYDINVYIVGLKYLGYFITYILLLKNKQFNYLFFKIMAIIQGFFISFEYFYVTNSGIDRIFYLLLFAFIIYFITFFCLYMFKLADGITNLHELVNNVEKENKLRDSLFKLTHEIKNPIAVCKGYLDMLNLDNKDKSEKYIGIVKSEIDRSLNVMNDFMEYNKIKIEKEEFDMTMLLDEVYDSFKFLINDKKIKFRYDNQYEDIYVMGDFNRLKQVFVNVIKNSLESIEKDGIIDIRVKVNDLEVIVEIEDNGIGMDEWELANIKEMFYSTKKNGTGLGVALSNEIILAHNGKLKYSSRKNEGTICSISLPL